MRNPNDDYPKWMMVMLLIIVSYFVTVVIPQLIFKLL